MSPTEPGKRRRVLFICTGNACRSPMAEGLLRRLAGDRYECLSAGSHPAGFVHELAVRALAELGADISRHRSKSFREFVPPRGEVPEVIVTLCSFARAQCGDRIQGTTSLHWPVFDPILAEGSPEERLQVFRQVRDDLRARIEDALRTGLFER
jgi:arsenate reductase